MLAAYPAIIHNDDDGIWVEFPDLPGCQTYGETLEDTLVYAGEALGSYLAVRLDAGDSIPAASPIESIVTDDSKTYIYTDVNKYHRDTKAVKKMISIPAWLAKEAVARNYSLSKVLQEALMEKLNMA